MTEMEKFNIETLTPKIILDLFTKHKLLDLAKVESPVVVHSSRTGSMNNIIRIWVSTFIYTKMRSIYIK